MRKQEAAKKEEIKRTKQQQEDSQERDWQDEESRIPNSRPEEAHEEALGNAIEAGRRICFVEIFALLRSLPS